MSENLNKRTVNGISWSMVETGSTYVVRFVVGIILARLLTPSDFGIIGIIMIFISISDTFISAGFGQAFIQKKDTSDVDANSVFIINLSLSLIVYFALFLLAPYISNYFCEPLLIDVTRVLSLVVIISSLNVIQKAIIRKELLFKKRAIITVTSALYSGIVGISCAYFGMGVWSIVFQQLAAQTILSILFIKYSTWHFSFSFSMESIRTLFAFGGWMLLANLLICAFGNIYRFAIGKFFSAADLGYYERARQFESLVTQTATTVFGNVAFPVFSKLQDDKDKLKEMTCNFVMYSSAFVYPILICGIIVAKPFIAFLLTEKWLPCVPYLRLLCIVGFLSPIYFYIAPLLQSVGKSKETFWYTMFLSVFRVFNIVVSYRYGISGIIIGEFFALLLTTIIMSRVISTHVGFNYLCVISRLKFIYIAAFISGITGYYLYHILQGYNDFMIILVVSSIIVGVYLLLLTSLDKNIKIKMVEIVNKKR